MDQILALENVEDAPLDTKYYFNFGNVERVSSLQDDLKRAGVDPTVLVHAEANPFCVYYTPKNARMIANGGWQQD